jgi:hypothetical protein
MEPRILPTMFVAVLLALPSAASAFAAESAVDQSVEVEVIPDDGAGTLAPADEDVRVDVLPEDVLGIEVEDVSLGTVVPGADVEQRFGMRVLNSTSAGWQVSVEASELRANDERCADEEAAAPSCADREGRVATIPLSSLRLRGGSVEGVITAEEGSLDDQPLLLMRGGADRGTYLFEEDPPLVKLSVPAETAYGRYRTTLTYTITSAEADVP